MKRNVVRLALTVGLGVCAVMAGGAAGAADSGPCTVATKGDSPIAKACAEGGIKAAKKKMKDLTTTARNNGTTFECDACHKEGSGSAYELTSDAREKLKKLLAAAGVAAAASAPSAPSAPAKGTTAPTPTPKGTTAPTPTPTNAPTAAAAPTTSGAGGSAAPPAAGAAPAAGDGDPVKTDPAKYKLVTENERVRVLRYHDRPGEKTTMHHHPDFVLQALTSFKRRLTMPDGRTKERAFKAGEIVLMEAQSHIGENIGKTDTNAIIVELKEPRPAPAKHGN